MAGIIWSKEARQDLDTIFLWLEKESKSYATKWINEVIKKLDLIEKFPNMGKKLPEMQVKSIREISAGKYRIIYNVTKEDLIEVLAIRHSAKPLSEF
jgi:toxin ParE1/3/4